MGLIVIGPTGGFRPSQMVRSGAGGTLSSGWSKVLGWVADTVNYPGSVVTSDELVVLGDGGGLSVSANVEFSNSGFAERKVTLRLMLSGNTTPLATGAESPGMSSFGGTAFATVTASGLTLADAQRVYLEASPTTANNVSATANVTSYVRIYRP